MTFEKPVVSFFGDLFQEYMNFFSLEFDIVGEEKRWSVVVLVRSNKTCSKMVAFSNNEQQYPVGALFMSRDFTKQQKKFCVCVHWQCGGCGDGGINNVRIFFKEQVQAETKLVPVHKVLKNCRRDLCN
ncbi:hypothetical protein T02_11597 [Trichinella nativa]|uniref:Uncharacterized protein n=1 Tax=Trichinella nativa TaxID=6335 RepID=A0A0V1KV12_9BILA|nr:hypothetical protein T02_11597 [Trichinella nativa]